MTSTLGSVNQNCLRFYQNPASLYKKIFPLSSHCGHTFRFKMTSEKKSYDFVVLGGTFDRIHDGHEILLKEARDRCHKKMTIGVTNNEMTKSKTLSELILPVDTRISSLRTYLEEKNKELEYEIVPISDPFGPSIIDPDLQAIVGSQETERGCLIVNEKRKDKGLSQLDIILVDLKEDEQRENEEVEESKVSSSSLRIRLLGTLLKPTLKPYDPNEPYVIGLTGGSASGKTSVSERLDGLGLCVINCDKLGHLAYEVGSDCYENIIEEFGTKILDESSSKIDRRALGKMVFEKPELRYKLENLVWPEIKQKAEDIIEENWLKGQKIFVLDAAVLLQANWHDDICHEVWSCIIPREEAVKRIMERDGKTKTEAQQRLDSQMSNEEVVKESNVVLCTLWSREFTQKQIQRAKTLLMNRLTS